MAAIKRVLVQFLTGNQMGAGTSGEVYLAMCGREFRIEPEIGRFDKGSDRTFELGGTIRRRVGQNVKNSEDNDPRVPQLDSDDLSKFPMYVRFEPSSTNPKWNLGEVHVTVTLENNNDFNFRRVLDSFGLWFGQAAGKYCFLRND